MSRTLSAAALKSMFAEETGDYPILLVTLSCAELSDDIRISSDPTSRLLETDEEIIYGTTSIGRQYLFLPFQLKLPDENDEGAPQMSVTFDNVGRDMVPAIRSVSSDVTMTTDIVMSCSPNVVEASFPDFIVSNVEYDELAISVSLILDLFDSEPFPADSMTPSNYPGLFSS